MKIIAKTLLASSLCVLMTVPAHAGRDYDDGRLLDRLERQHARIVSGLDSGALTRKEGMVLKKEKHKTRRMARKFLEDGKLSKRERHILSRLMNQRSDRIREFKHNDSDRHSFRNTCRDADSHHRHQQHDGHHDDGGGIATRFKDSDSLHRYGFLFR